MLVKVGAEEMTQLLRVCNFCKWVKFRSQYPYPISANPLTLAARDSMASSKHTHTQALIYTSFWVISQRSLRDSSLLLESSVAPSRREFPIAEEIMHFRHRSWIFELDLTWKYSLLRTSFHSTRRCYTVVKRSGGLHPAWLPSTRLA